MTRTRKLPPTSRLALAASAAAGEWDTWHDAGTLRDGRTVHVRIERDDSQECPTKHSDGMGSVHAVRSSRDPRPSECNGDARKFMNSSGDAYWWQPDADWRTAYGEGAGIDQTFDRVRGWYRDEWTWVGLIVRVTYPPCRCCGHRSHETNSLWGIESDAGDYFAEVARACFAEIPEKPPTHKGA